MNKAQYEIRKDAPIQPISNACEVVSLSAGQVKKYASNCGALLKIGRSVRVNVPKLVEYLATLKM
ncbi:MAG: hypothetical protein J6L69_08405 [Lachnospiraceae bacterium]|nr:hypothetical protein [Lachnospiraceae bacterium]